MSIKVTWYDERRDIILCTFHGKWTWKQIAQSTQQANALAAQVTTHPPMLYDIRTMAVVPDDFIAGLEENLTERNPAPRVVVLSEDDAAIRAIFQRMQQRYPDLFDHYTLVTTLDAALALLRATP